MEYWKIKQEENKLFKNSNINLNNCVFIETRMTTFIKTKFKKSDEKTNIDNYRIAANFTEYHIISKLIFLRIIITKFINIRQLFYVKMLVFKIAVWDFWLQLSIELLRFLHCTSLY